MMAADEPTDDRTNCNCEDDHVLRLEAVLTAARAYMRYGGLQSYRKMAEAVRAADAHSPQNATKSTETADTPAPNPEDQ